MAVVAAAVVLFTSHLTHLSSPTPPGVVLPQIGGLGTSLNPALAVHGANGSLKSGMVCRCIFYASKQFDLCLFLLSLLLLLPPGCFCFIFI